MNTTDSNDTAGSKKRYTVNEKIAFLKEYNMVEFGLRKQFCRDKGIPLTCAQDWAKRQRDGLLEPTDKKESRLALTRAERLEFNAQKREIAELRTRLAQSESAVEVLGKASSLLESLAKSAEANHTRVDPHQDHDDPPASGNRYEA